MRDYVAVRVSASRASPPFSAFCIGVRPRCDLESKRRRQPSRERTLAPTTGVSVSSSFSLETLALPTDRAIGPVAREVEPHFAERRDLLSSSRRPRGAAARASCASTRSAWA
jgi:hypothetical protein